VINASLRLASTAQFEGGGGVVSPGFKVEVVEVVVVVVVVGLFAGSEVSMTTWHLAWRCNCVSAKQDTAFPVLTLIIARCSWS
jgi:hypothetical protein